MKNMIMLVILLSAMQGLHAMEEAQALPPEIFLCDSDKDCKEKGENLICKNKKICISIEDDSIMFDPNTDRPFTCEVDGDCAVNEACIPKGICELRE